MRSAATRSTLVVLFTASAATLCGCSGASGEPARPGPQTVAVEQSAVKSTPAPVAAPEAAPVDARTAKLAWQDGVAQFDQGRYEAAAKSLATAAKGRPTDAYGRYLLGLALARSGDLSGAETALVESAGLDGTRIKTWINLARVRNDRGDRTGALDAADHALAVDATSADALHQRGRALMELGRADEAADTLTKAREIAPDNGYVANTLGLLLIDRGTPQDAIPHLETARTLLPNVAYVRNNLGVAYERTGRLSDAKLEYLAAVEAGDTGGKAARSLARLGGSHPSESPETLVGTNAQPQ